MMINIFLIEPNVVPDGDKNNINKIISSINKNNQVNNFEIVNVAENAELVVLVDTCTFKTQKDIKYFQSILDFNKGKTKLCTINYEDAPPGFLPGLYSSLEAFKFDPAIHLSWPHLTIPNEQISNDRLRDEMDPDILFTFSGSCSNPIRRKLFDLYEGYSSKFIVKEVKKWYNHNDDEKRSYIDDIQRSKFVLCPKGIASYSHRILETMALGKVPVIIADDWVPFSIPEKDYFVRIPERSIVDIIPILEMEEANYEKIRESVKKVYSRYFNPSICYSVALNQLVELHNNRLSSISSAFLNKRWKSRKFWKNNGWSIEDRVIRKLKKVMYSFVKK